MDIIIPPAYGDVNSAAGFDFMGLLPLVLVFVVMYFLLIRPQQKKGQELRSMQQNLKKGDHILTNGGIFGEVVKVIGPDQALLEIADGVKVRVATSMIGSVVPATNRVATEASPAGSTSISSTVKSPATVMKSPSKKTPVKKSLLGMKAPSVGKKTPVKKSPTPTKPSSKTPKTKAKTASR